MTDSDRRPRRGDVVRVRTREEILATLDKNGDLDGMPFMPELLKYCGQELPVSARAHKTCDTIAQQGMRRLDHTVFLAGARCDGSAHDGCQANCLVFWREEWLEWPDRPGVPIRQSDPAGGGISLAELQEQTRVSTDPSEGPIYRCQATEIARASTPLSRKALWQYVADVRSRNVGLFRLLWGMLVDAFNKYQSITAEHFPRWLRIFGGRPYPFLRGTGTGERTPVTGLKPGDLVEVKSKAEIEATLDETNRNRRMVFDTEMVPFCRGRYRVERSVERILDETTGKMIRLSDCLVLENVFCQGIYHRFCQRSTPPYWREAWLRKVDQPTP